ncbi:hypothetical protein Leryth_017107 [Lithospermum erythrorhizon]|nr:hypothetical protein Leryth_017107 [Lithospermum erythrorhizon]
MADKEMAEGRCPACRTPYNKERIVRTSENCGKLVVGESMKKKKPHKSKTKTSEERKQLGNMRVIRKNLVCIMGWPRVLADEDLLQWKQYLGQYGKVQKVSISRSSAGAIQHNENDTYIVHVTYSKEEEAVRCIQAFNGLVLEGRPLRASFGTTKYCYAWLRNMPCRNRDCPYLHEIGSQKDSFRYN